MGDPIPANVEINSNIAPISEAASTHCLPAAVASSLKHRGSDASAGGCTQHRNMFDLPLELLIIIFQSFLPDVNPNHVRVWRDLICRIYLKRLYFLRLVSRTWRDILDDTPSFWIVITSTVPHTVNQTSIARSGDAPLTVYLGYRALEGFTELVLPTRHRWKVVWTDEHYKSKFWEYLTSPAPMIETVHLERRSATSDGFNLLGGETHNIRNLDLHKIQIQWGPSMFRGLKHLGLFESGGEGLTTDLIFEVLANSPDLEYLTFAFSEIQVSATSFFHPISLPRLHSLALKDLGNVVCHFLCHIEAPNCRMIEITTYHLEATTNEFLEEHFEPFESLFRELHTKSRNPKIHVKPDCMEWYEPRRPGFRIYASSDSFPPMLRWIERVVDWADLEGLEMEIEIAGTVLQDPEVTSILRRLRNVTKLSACRDDNNSQGTIRLLSDLDHNPIPVLPSLKVLHFVYQGVIPEEMLQIVRTRFAAHLNHQEGGGPRKLPDLEIIADIPSPVSLMPIKSLDFAVITQIRSIAGVRFTLNWLGVPREEDGMLAVVWDDERGVPHLEGYRYDSY